MGLAMSSRYLFYTDYPLFGFTSYFFCLQHLDGRDLVIHHPPGNVIEPGSTKMVPGEGMPRYRSPFEKGELYIKFDVSFPLSKKVRMETTNQISPHWPVRVLTLYCLFNEWTSSVE